MYAKEYHAEWYIKNKTRTNELQKQWYRDNRDKRNLTLKAWRLKNIDKVRAYGRALQKRKREFINRAKSVPCARCKIQYAPWIMQFDHRNPKEKAFAISKIGRSLDKVAAEINKCDILCANCHAQRTHEQDQACELGRNYAAQK